MGADLVVHSTTKYLFRQRHLDGGPLLRRLQARFDGSVRGQVSELDRTLSPPITMKVCASLAETFGPMAFTFHGIAIGLRDLGMCQSPQNAFHHAVSGIETLSLRMKKHVENAGTRIAAWLEADPRVERSTMYAGLPSSPWNERARRLYPRGAGAIFTFAVKGWF